MGVYRVYPGVCILGISPASLDSLAMFGALLEGVHGVLEVTRCK